MWNSSGSLIKSDIAQKMHLCVTKFRCNL
uniref:Uncharacterized protein n=1 Tax=Anguilla anguilla TaxID=7936 RepID=A0A0E9W9B1_ANGAN